VPHRYEVLNFENNARFKVHIKDYHMYKTICNWF
jgi:hypothetical protein